MVEIDKFKQVFKAPAITNRYKIIIPKFLDNSNYQYFSKEVEFPGKEIKTTNVNFFGGELSFAESIDFDPINITFYCDAEMTIKKKFDDWFKYIFDTNTWTVKYLEEYSVDMNIEVMNLKGESVEIAVIESAFPTNISSVSLSYDNNDTVYIFTVVFQYWAWWYK